MRELTDWTKRIADTLCEVIKSTGLYYYRNPHCNTVCCLLYTENEFDLVTSDLFNPNGLDDPGTVAVWTDVEREGAHADGRLRLAVFPCANTSERQIERIIKESWLKTDEFKDFCKECAKLRVYDEDSKEAMLVINNIMAILDMVNLE